jgi:hypothetical protein
MDSERSGPNRPCGLTPSLSDRSAKADHLDVWITPTSRRACTARAVSPRVTPLPRSPSSSRVMFCEPAAVPLASHAHAAIHRGAERLHHSLAIRASGPHPFPFRTRSLSLTAPMVLRSRDRGRVGHRRHLRTRPPSSHDGGGRVVFECCPARVSYDL